MPVLCSFNCLAQSEITVNYPHPFVARPRLAHGIRHLDMDKNHFTHVKSVIPFFTKDWTNCRFVAMEGAKLYRGIGDVFALAPCDLDFLTGEHMRFLRQNPKSPASVRINFERPFVTPPKVVVFLNRLEFDWKRNWRVITTATNIDVNGFTLNIETWSDTILHCAQTCWIAYPEDREYIFSTSVSTMEVRPWNQPQDQTNKELSFNSIEFIKKPSAFIALNYLDMDCKANLRINAHVDGITTTGLTWHLDTFSDSVLYGAGASIIAFN
jgi:hypothetical protein